MDLYIQFSLLNANVGNISPGCYKYKNNLCYLEVFERLRKNIRKLSPDIITLQEMLAPWQCYGPKESDPSKICSKNIKIPVRSLLGKHYSIVCNARNEFTCVAVHSRFGWIKGVPTGGYAVTTRVTPKLGLCDNDFLAMGVTVVEKSRYTFDVINVHLPPMRVGSACRTWLIDSMFKQLSFIKKPLITQKRIIIAGDFNFDPWREKDDVVQLWNRYMQKGFAGKSLRYVSDTSAPVPYKTHHNKIIRRTYDFAVSNFIDFGVLKVLGQSPSTTRLDGGQGCDHMALYGQLGVTIERK